MTPPFDAPMGISDVVNVMNRIVDLLDDNAAMVERIDRCADYDGDGTVTITDVVDLINVLVGLEGVGYVPL